MVNSQQGSNRSVIGTQAGVVGPILGGVAPTCDSTNEASQIFSMKCLMTTTIDSLFETLASTNIDLL